jgi:CRP-like cAMP-binding protein
MGDLNKLLVSINKIEQLTEAEQEIIASKVQYCEYKKNELILSEGQVEKYVYYILEGIVRNYCMKNGDDISLDFFFTGEFTNSYMSFLTCEKSIVMVESLTNTRLFRLHSNDLAMLYETSLSFNKIGRIISEQLYIKRTMRELAFITMSAAERYDQLRCTHPELIQRIPQKYLSTFLGISPETLSRLRSKKQVH